MRKLSVIVCTCKRPLMLRACINSLLECLLPIGVSMDVVVVDNDPHEKHARGVVSAFERTLPRNVRLHYVAEPRRGIAFARNAGMHRALDLGAEQIAFTDDDCWVSPDWAAMIMHPDYDDTPVLCGFHQLIHPTPIPYWVPYPARFGSATPPKEGSPRRVAFTCNARVAAHIVRSGHWFDESLGLMGGEDNEFFARIHQDGYRFRQTARARTYEIIHPERCTFHGQMSRQYWCAISNIRRDIIKYGRAGTFVRKVASVPVHMVVGAMLSATAPLWLLIGNSRRWRYQAVYGAKRVTKAIGRVAGFIGLKAAPYRTICGE